MKVCETFGTYYRYTVFRFGDRFYKIVVGTAIEGLVVYHGPVIETYAEYAYVWRDRTHSGADEFAIEGNPYDLPLYGAVCAAPEVFLMEALL